VSRAGASETLLVFLCRTFRIVAKAINPQDRKAEVQGEICAGSGSTDDANAAVAFRTQLINEIKMGTTRDGVPTEIPRPETSCRSSWITFVTENVSSESRAAKLARVIETHILRRWGDHFIDKITELHHVIIACVVAGVLDQRAVLEVTRVGRCSGAGLARRPASSATSKPAGS